MGGPIHGAANLGGIWWSRLPTPDKLRRTLISQPPNRIIDDTACFIFKKWRHLLWPGDATRIKGSLKVWAEAIARRVRMGPEDVPCFGFVDGTKRQCAAPKDAHQFAGISDGHHKMEAFGYIGTVSPDGLFIQFWGPFTGGNNDWQMISDSRLLEMLEQGFFKDSDGKQYFVYGDLGFHVRKNMLTGWNEADKQRAANAAMKRQYEEFNREWSGARVSVEWGFGDVTAEFESLNLLFFQKPNVSRIGVWYLVAVLLTNCWKCYNGRGKFFCDPPSIREYLRPWDATFEATFREWRPRKYIFRMEEEETNEWNVGSAESDDDEEGEEDEDAESEVDST